MGAESRSSRSPHVDATLARLLEVERGIEERLRAAEHEAARRVEEARASSRQALADGRVALEAALQEAEAADLARHADVLHEIEVEHRARMVAISSLSDGDVDLLAREALAIVLGSEGGGR